MGRVVQRDKRNRNERILVVEDELTVARLIEDVLREEGYRVEAVLDSRHALKLIRRNNYDLVICDLRMPHMDGAALHAELARHSSPLANKLVFVTGDTLAPHTAQFLKQSGRPCVQKPFLVHELLEAVAGALAAINDRETPQFATAGGHHVQPIGGKPKQTHK